MNLNLQAANHASDILSPIFQSMGWSWGDNKHVPTHYEIMETVEDLMRDCPNVGDNMGTGRIVVERTKDGWEVSLTVLITHDAS